MGKICLYGLCMGFGVNTALINLHPVSGSAEYGFELCRMYTGHKARLKTILFPSTNSLVAYMYLIYFVIPLYFSFY